MQIMPIYYQFQNHLGVPINLDIIDNEICQDFDIVCSSISYSYMFDIITLIGDYSTKTGYFNLDDFNEAIHKCEYDENNRWKILKYLNGKYKYSSWR